MDFGAVAYWIFVPIQIFFLDLLLGADNAVMIALACRSLHRDDTRKAVLLGTGGAILFRLVLTVAASFLLTLPYLKLAGAVVLIVIAINVIEQEEPGDLDLSAEASGSSLVARGSLRSAALIIVLADATMSLDNVVALVAIARGNIWLLAAGLLFSIPVLMFGSVILAQLLRKYSVLVTAGCGLLGWIAGDLAVSDPVIADWANAYVPALVLISPVLGAVFVLVQARFIADDRKTYAEANVARAPNSALNAGKRFPAQLLDWPAAADRLPNMSRKVDPASPEIGKAPRASDAPSGRQGEPAGRAPQGKASDDRFVLIGLLLLATVAGGMIVYVIYLDSLLNR
jgi:YjbE family integral membrane protein